MRATGHERPVAKHPETGSFMRIADLSPTSPFARLATIPAQLQLSLNACFSVPKLPM